MRKPNPIDRDDPRTVDELIAFILQRRGDSAEEDFAWDAVCALHFRGSAEVLERARRLCRGRLAAERRLGADILGQLGVPERTFPAECVGILLEMLTQETDADVLPGIFIALGHHQDTAVIEPVSRFRRHPDRNVRNGVVHALTGYEEPRAIDCLIALSQDENSHVRDWATFALGSQLDVDTPAIREALFQRLSDTDPDARGEAMVGLAKRGDRRAVPAIAEELTADEIGTLPLEAAALAADAALYPRLAALEPSDDFRELLAEALRACSPGKGSP